MLLDGYGEEVRDSYVRIHRMTLLMSGLYQDVSGTRGYERASQQCDTFLGKNQELCRYPNDMRMIPYTNETPPSR